MRQVSEFVAGPVGGPETLFRLSLIELLPDAARMSMRTGDWLRGEHGEPCAGALGVLADNILGNALASLRPADSWLVTTEISVDFCAPVPTDGSLLMADARPVHVRGLGGLSAGELRDEAGELVATCSFRGRFTSGAAQLPAERYGLAALGPPDIPVPERSSVESLLGLTVHNGVAATLPVIEMFANPVGNLHGGILFCASEIVGARALRLPTTSVRMTFLRPGPMTGEVTFTAEVLHSGRTFGVAKVTAAGENGKPCTIATVVCQDET